MIADTTYTYDAANRLASIVHTDGVTPLAARNYGLDAAGNLSSEAVSGTLVLAEPLPDPAALTYNLANQVTRRNAASYSYDTDGNSFDGVSLLLGPVYKDISPNIGGNDDDEIVDSFYSERYTNYYVYFIQYHRPY